MSGATKQFIQAWSQRQEQGQCGDLCESGQGKTKNHRQEKRNAMNKTTTMFPLLSLAVVCFGACLSLSCSVGFVSFFAAWSYNVYILVTSNNERLLLLALRLLLPVRLLLLHVLTHGMTYTHALIPSSPFTHIYISGVGAVKIRSPLFPHAHAGFAVTK